MNESLKLAITGHPNWVSISSASSMGTIERLGGIGFGAKNESIAVAKSEAQELTANLRRLTKLVRAAHNASMSPLTIGPVPANRQLGVRVLAPDSERQREMLKRRFGSHDCSESITANPNIKIAFKLTPAPNATSLHQRM